MQLESLLEVLSVVPCCSSFQVGDVAGVVLFTRRIACAMQALAVLSSGVTLAREAVVEESGARVDIPPTQLPRGLMLRNMPHLILPVS